MKYENRDISWLGFNHRVLQEAGDKNVPLMERVKFLSIFSSNMDEFFRVRYPVISLYSHLKNKILTRIIPPPPKNMEEQVQQIVGGQFEEFGHIFSNEILPELESEKIILYYNRSIPPSYAAQVRELFFSRTLAFIQPIFIGESFENDFFPESNKIYFLVLLKKDGEEFLHHAVINIPTEKLQRFYTL